MASECIVPCKGVMNCLFIFFYCSLRSTCNVVKIVKKKAKQMFFLSNGLYYVCFDPSLKRSVWIGLVNSTLYIRGAQPCSWWLELELNIAGQLIARSRVGHPCSISRVNHSHMRLNLHSGQLNYVWNLPLAKKFLDFTHQCVSWRLSIYV